MPRTRLSTRSDDWRMPNRSFTLVEMLVVIAIMCILAALLLPGLRSTIALAHATFCSNNLRQFGSGFLQYANDNNRTFPPTGGSFVLANERGHTCNYLALIRPYYMAPLDGRYAWTATHTLIPSPEMEKCPSDIRADEDARTSFAAVALPSTAPRSKYRFYKSPSRTPMLWDNDFYVSGGAYGAGKWWCDALLYFRHAHNLNWWFLDGHVESRGDYLATTLFTIHNTGNAP